MAKEGSEVIQANNRRVAAAKKAAALTARNLQAAKLALEAAQKTVQAAQKAVEASQKDHNEATDELKDAEQSQKAAQKKWEVVDHVEDDEEKTKSSNRGKKRSGVPSDSESNNAGKKFKSDSDIPKEVLVEGCGVAGVNGTYKRDTYCHGSLLYSKTGQWKGQDVRFDIFCLAYPKRIWFISVQCGVLYRNASDKSVPPSDGWGLSQYGIAPPPKITLNT